MTASLIILSIKADSNTWESFTRSGLKLESVNQESPHSDVFRKRLKPRLKQEQCQKHLTCAKEKKNWTVAQWSKVLFSDKSKFGILFGNQGLESTLKNLNFSVLQILFLIDLRKYLNILRFLFYF